MDQGIYSGISFYVQLKSAADVSRFRLKSHVLSYPSEVKDIIHWSRSAVPVVFVIWDVETETGYWLDVASFAKQLEMKDPSWKNNKAVRLHISLEQDTSDSGLKRLRRMLADYYFPSFSRDKQLTITTKLRFPSNASGDVELGKVRSAIETGDALTIHSEFVDEITFSEWFHDLYGEPPFKGGEVKLLPIPPSTSHFARVDAIDELGNRSSIHTEFRVVKQGTIQATFSNQHLSVPLIISLKFDQVDSRLSITIFLQFAGHRASDVKEALQFFEKVMNGGNICLTDLSTKISGQAYSPVMKQHDVVDPSVREFVHDICYIEEKTGCPLTFPDEPITLDVVNDVSRIRRILQCGRYVGTNGTAMLTADKTMLLAAKEDPDGLVRVEYRHESYKVELFGSPLELGPVSWEIEGFFQPSLAEIEFLLHTWQDKATIDIPLRLSSFIGVFDNWPRDL